jgi:3-oxoacyl-[acyl-carrier protein] reductase
MDLGIKGKQAIVCASSRGLGRACAQALAEAGVNLVINGLNEERLKLVAEEIASSTGVTVTPVACDVSTPEGQQKLLAACPAPDILVNNNGGPPFKDFRELDNDAMIDGINMNMLTPIGMVQKVLDGMVERGFGRIINITSMTVKMPVAGLDLSSGARAGLTAFLAGIARTVADKNVTINNILPGYFATDRLEGAFNKGMAASGKDRETVASELASTIPANRFGDPKEFGNTCAFLASHFGGYITGQNILLDGGLNPSAF